MLWFFSLNNLDPKNQAISASDFTWFACDLNRYALANYMNKIPVYVMRMCIG